MPAEKWIWTQKQKYHVLVNGSATHFCNTGTYIFIRLLTSRNLFTFANCVHSHVVSGLFIRGLPLELGQLWQSYSFSHSAVIHSVPGPAPRWQPQAGESGGQRAGMCLTHVILTLKSATRFRAPRGSVSPRGGPPPLPPRAGGLQFRLV